MGKALSNSSSGPEKDDIKLVQTRRHFPEENSDALQAGGVGGREGQSERCAHKLSCHQMHNVHRYPCEDEHERDRTSTRATREWRSESVLVTTSIISPVNPRNEKRIPPRSPQPVWPGRSVRLYRFYGLTTEQGLHLASWLYDASSDVGFSPVWKCTEIDEFVVVVVVVLLHKRSSMCTTVYRPAWPCTSSSSQTNTPVWRKTPRKSQTINQ